MDVEGTITATNKKLSEILNRFPSAITRGKDSNIYNLLYTAAYEEVCLDQAIQGVIDSRDILKAAEDHPADPEEVSLHIDLFAAPMAVQRASPDGEHPEGNASYRTRIINERFSRLSDGSMGDIANYVNALTGLGHPAVGVTYNTDDSGKITGVSRPFPKEQFVIHEGHWLE